MKIATPPNLWVVEFSHSQRAFSVSQLSESVSQNLEMYLNDQPCDHAIVAIAASRASAMAVQGILDSRIDRAVPFDLEAKRAIVKQLHELGALDFMADA